MSQLDNKIKFNETEYDVTATYSDEANHTTNKLSVHLNNKSQTNVEFDGSESKNISIVPSDGGTFTGALKIECENSEQNTENLTGANLMTLSNVYDVVEQLRGLPFCTISEDGLVSNETNGENGINPINIALGNNTAINALASKLQEIESIDTSYLCLSTDYPNDIYFIYYNKIAKKIECLLLSGHSQKLITLKENDTIEYTAESLEAKFNEIITDVTDLNTIIGTNEDGISHEKKFTDINTRISDTNIQLGVIRARVINNLQNISDIINGTIKVKSAEKADEANKATYDDANNHIRNNYYRGTANSTNANTITISTAAPNTNSGLTGDIWITYSESS